MEDLSRLKIDRDDKMGARRTSRRVRRRYLLLLLLTLCGAGAYLYLKPDLAVLQPKIAVEVGTVTTAYPSQGVSLFNATGYVVPQTRADIASKATGRLEALDVEEGSVVKKGQVIARVENQDVVAVMERTKANVDAARAAVNEARARAGEAQARVAEARAELQDSERSLARAQAMVGRQYVTREFHDAALARHDKAVAGIASAQAAAAAAGASVATAEAQVAAATAAHEEAKVAVEYTFIRAPFDGVILSKHADIGDVVAPFSSTTQSKGAVVSMADLDTLQVEADVSEANLTKVTAGQPCEIQLDALPEVRLRGEVHMVVPTVDRTKATVLAKVRFIDRDNRILPDMSARVAFLTRAIDPSEQRPRIVVQPSAVVTRNGRSTVFRLTGETVSEVPIETGGPLGDMLLITRGLLAPGDKVVLSPPEKLRDGMKVSPPKT